MSPCHGGAAPRMTECRGQSRGCWRGQDGQADKPYSWASQQKEDCKNLLREEGEGRSSLSLAKFRRAWTWECRPGQKSILALSLLWIRSSAGPQPGATAAGPSRKKRQCQRFHVWRLWDQSFPLGKQRSEHTVIEATTFHSCCALSHTQEGCDHISAPLQATMASPASVTSDQLIQKTAKESLLIMYVF